MELESGFRTIRNSVERRMPPDSLRQSLLREFARTSRLRMRQRIATWTLAAAAVLICIVAMRQQKPAIAEQASLQISLEDGFQAVPYAPALAQGELVRLVHTQVAPDTLTRLGLFVADRSSDSIPVDLVVGQDNAPLAVRVDEEDKENKDDD